MKLSKSDMIDELEERAYVEVSIECDKCKNGTYLNEINSGEYAYAMGWRIIEDECLCPICVKQTKDH